MKEQRDSRYREEKRKDEREERRRDDRDNKRKEDKDDKDDRRKDDRDDRRKDDRDDRRKDHRDDRRKEDDRHRDDRDDRQKDRRNDDKEQRYKRKHKPSYGEPKEKRSWRNEDANKSPDHKTEKYVDEEEDGGVTEKLSLSIEETNKLRAKLGLKPLSMGNDKDAVTTATDKPDVHVPAINIAHVKRQEVLKEKLQTIKEKRRLEESLFKAGPLGQLAEEEESAIAWVERIRKEAIKKQQEEAKAKELDELDREFGIGGLVEKEFGNEPKSYNANDLKGLKIEHNFVSFKEGRDVILTLKDKGVLEDGDDVLVNVNMIDDEKATQNVENKKNKPAYNPYDDNEFDNDGNLKEKVLLSKYDDEIRGGPAKESFFIGHRGKSEFEKKPDIVKLNITNDSLKLPELLPVNDYYTMDEMTSFKKPNRKMKRNVRKKVKLTADELLATVVNEDEPPTEEQMEVTNNVPDKLKMPSLDDIERSLMKEDDDDDDDMLGMDTSVFNDREWLDIELDKKSKQTVQKMTNFDSLVMHIKAEYDSASEKDISEIDKPDNNTFYMNSTAEFCRSLGEFMTSSSGPNPFKDEDYDDMEVQQSGNDGTVRQGWQSVEIDEKPVTETRVEETHILDEEPIIDHGLGAALKLASKKGYLDPLIAKQVIPKHSTLEALNYSVEDKKMDDLEDKYSGRRSKYSAGSGGGGPIVDFKEKHGYKPEIKLEYVDDHGREMSKKEAFRYLSHKFHGKGSGKKKLEKRMKKAEEDSLLRSMSSTDTPLNTAQLLQDKQKANKVPYVVLSGGKGLVTNIITK